MESLQLKTGDVHQLVLEGRGAAGYGWSATVEDIAIVTVERTGTVPKQQSSRQTTGSRDEVFTLTAHAAGRTGVHFSLTRPWEKGGKALAKRDFEVTVSG
jgi:predicted secreted protein